ncbi:hypothetical protein [Fumia xinanensis]|uniref:Uncharacterized protein n=1 Tax=Fumia xinanensis TaxID=2763659 RepID=A0A926E510_9FIRM|nr:hypothetical protein [Fumia xinanensis]MBC8559683.1 hypothetical protein [Fumia xinanensis]
MRANNAGDFLRMLNPDDCIYGFKKLSNWDLDKVIKLYKDRGVLRGVSDRDEARKILWDSTYNGDRRDVYGEDLIKSGALEVPGPLKGLSVKKIREKLQKHKLYSYTFRVSFEGNHKNAIKVLQQSLNLSVTGRYTEDVARAVYEKVKGDIKKGQGYLASEDDPDRLFKSGFQEYVFCVDKVVWGLCGIEEKFLVDDGGTVWKEHGPDISTDSDAQCRKVLKDMDNFGYGYVMTNGMNERVQKIHQDAEAKAQEALEYLMGTAAVTILNSRGSIRDASYQQKYLFAAKTSFDEYTMYSNWKQALVDIVNIGGLVIDTAEDSEPFLVFFFSPSYWKLISVGAILVFGFLHYMDPSPGLADAIDSIKIPTKYVNSTRYDEVVVRSGDWQYLIEDTATNVRNKMIQVVNKQIDYWKSNPIEYSSSPYETELYNRFIIEYLEGVVFMNEHFDEMDVALQKLLDQSPFK